MTSDEISRGFNVLAAFCGLPPFPLEDRAMKYKIAELEGALLDAAVAKAEGVAPKRTLVKVTFDGDTPAEFRLIHRPYSTDGRLGITIIDRERIELSPTGGADNPWLAQCTGWPHQDSDGIWRGIGPTPLIAAMRAYCASRFGEEVELS